MMSVRGGPWWSFRHVFTSAPENHPGGGGFKTVACSAALGEKLSRIEDLVESYKNLEGGGERCRQFVSLAQGKSYAFTLFTPLADSSDGRTGNFWAETQVVPSDWLEPAGWDAAAAFDALSWWGPQNIARLPSDLEPEPLPALSPRPLDCLARLDELVPSACLEPLLHAVVLQSSGLRSLELLEAQGEPSAHLDEIVMLLPLTVPPTSRRHGNAEQLRCMSLRTRCPVGGMAFRTDITGYPTAAADGLEFSDGVVVELAGRVPTDLSGDKFGRDYAKWLRGVIQKGEWDQLESLYRRAIDLPGPSFFAKYKSLLQSPDRSRATINADVPEPAGADPERTAESEPPSVEVPKVVVAPPAAVLEETVIMPIQVWKEESLLQSPDRSRATINADVSEPAGADPECTAESEPPSVEVPKVVVAPPAAVLEETVIMPIQVWKEESAVRNDLKGALWKVRESHKKQIEELVGEIGKEFAADIEKAQDRLAREIASRQEGVNTKLKEFEKEIKKAGKGSPPKSAPPVRDSSAVEARLEKLERALAEVAERLAALDGKGEVLNAGEDAQSRRSFQELLTLSLDWLRDHRRVVWTAGIGIVLVFLGVLSLHWAWRIPPKWFEPDDEIAVKAKEDALLQQVESGKNAAQILAGAARSDLAGESAHLEILTIALSHGIQIEDKLNCALLQSALRVPVDGACGSGTNVALGLASKAACCQSFQLNPMDVVKLQNCFVADHLRLGSEEEGQGVEACTGESPWREGRIWTHEEATKALNLFQAAANVFQGEQTSDLARNLRDLDPTRSPSLRHGLVGETLTRDEAQRILELAWTSWRGRRARLEELSAGQLDDLGRVVDQIIEQGESAPAGADGRSTVR